MSRRYTDAEVRALVRAATERQEAERQAADTHAQGLTLDEVEHLAADLGLRPEHLRAAARDLDARPARRREASGDAPRLLGLPTRYRASRLLPRPLADDAWAAIVGDLRGLSRTDGLAGQVGRVREWTGRGHGLGGDIRVSAVPEAGGTRFVVEQDVRGGVRGLGVAGAIYLVFCLMFVVLGLLEGDADALWLVGLMGTISLLLLGGQQVGYRVYERAQTRTFEAVLDRAEVHARQFAEGLPEPSAEASALSEASAGPEPSGPEPSADPPGLGALNIPGLPEAEAPASARRTRS